MNATSNLRAALVAAPLVLGIATVAQAENAKLGVGMIDANANVIALKEFVQTLKAKTSIDAKVYQAELLSLSETPEGLRDRIVDIGYVVTGYKPAEYSETNLGADLSMLMTAGEPIKAPGAAMAGAMMEYVLLNCADCVAEYGTMNQVAFGITPTTSYALLCNTPVTTIDQLKGKRIRAGAANFGRWVESFGATKSTISGAETFDALSQHVVDCTVHAPSELIGTNFIEVVSDVTLGVPGGVFAGLATNNVNKDYWKELSEEDRATYIRETARLVANIQMLYLKGDADSLAASEQRGIKIHEAAPAFVAASDAFVDADVPLISASFANNYGVENVDAKVAKLRELITRWKGLVKDIGPGDGDKLTDLYWNEVLSKVDPKTYGLN